jgi:hypothetical protein
LPDPTREARPSAAPHYREFVDYGDAAGISSSCRWRTRLEDEKTAERP